MAPKRRQMKVYKALFQNKDNTVPNDLIVDTDFKKGLISDSAIIVRDEYNYNNFIVLQNVDELEKYIYDLVPEKRCLHEIILGWKDQKIKFDLEHEVDNPDEINIEKALHSLKTTILDTFYESYYVYCEKELRESDLVISSASGWVEKDDGRKYYKHSYHIVLNGYCVANNLEANEFTRRVYAANKEYGFLIDLEVNKSTQGMRIAYCHKKGSDRIKTIISPEHTFPDTIVQYVTDCVRLPAIEQTSKKATGKLALIDNSASDLSEANIEIVLEAIKQHTDGFVYTSSVKNMLFFRRELPTFCSICERTHDSDNSLMVYVFNEQIYKICRRDESKPKRKELIGSFVNNNAVSHRNYVDRQIHYITSRDENQDTPELRCAEETKFDKLPESSKHVYRWKTLKPYELLPTLVVHADMKMGKTKTLKEYLIRYFPNDSIVRYRIVILSFRQTFSRELLSKYKELGFVLYSDIESRKITDERVIIQTESMHRYSPGNEPIDLLIIDESESIFEQFDSGLFKNFKMSFSVFTWLMRTAKHLVAMDANISDRTYNILSKLRCTKSNSVNGVHYPFYHCNKFRQATTDKYYFTNTEAEWRYVLTEYLTQGSRICIPTNSFDEAQRLHEYITTKFPTKKVKLYNRETVQSEKNEHLSNVHKYWSEYDVIIYTPTITAGVSYELSRFDYVFGFFNDQSCTVETCRQMLGRIRDVKSKTYFINLNARAGYAPTKRTSIKRAILNNRMASMPEVDYEFDDNGMLQIYETEYYTIWLENTVMRNLSSNHFIRRFISQVYYGGSEVLSFGSLIDDEEAVALANNEFGVAAEIRDYKQAQAIADADELSGSDIVKIRDKGQNGEDVTEEENRARKKYMLRKVYHWDKQITADFVIMYNKRRYITMYNNLCKMYGFTIPPKEALNLCKAEEQAHRKILETKLCGGSSNKPQPVRSPNKLVKRSASPPKSPKKAVYVKADEKPAPPPPKPAPDAPTAPPDHLTPESLNLASFLDLQYNHSYLGHRLVIDILELCGYNTPNSKKLIPERVMEENVKNAFEYMSKNRLNLSYEFGKIGHIPITRNGTIDVKKGLKLINSLFDYMYGFKIKRVNRRNDAINNYHIVKDMPFEPRDVNHPTRPSLHFDEMQQSDQMIENTLNNYIEEQREWEMVEQYLIDELAS